MSDEDRLNEIANRARAATPGPWHHVDDDVFAARSCLGPEACVYDGCDGSEAAHSIQVACCQEAYETGVDDDAIFVAASRADVPWLVERLIEARKSLAAEPDESTNDAIVRMWAAMRARDALIDKMHDALECVRNKDEAVLTSRASALVDIALAECGCAGRIALRAEDLIVEPLASHGVTITHKPTGLSAGESSFPSALKNKAAALRTLREMIARADAGAPTRGTP